MTKVVTIKGEQYDAAKHSNADAVAVYDLGMKLHMLSIAMHEKNLTIENIDVWLALRIVLHDLNKLLLMQAKDNTDVIEIF